MQNVGAVARRFHQRGVGGIHIRRGGNIFRHGIEPQLSSAHAFLQDRLTRKLMREILVVSQKLGMGQRSFSQLVIPFQLVQTGFFALMVDQVKELLLTLRRPSVSM